MTYIYRPGVYNVTDYRRARIAQPGFSAATPWWLSGGIAAANCVAAYTPKGAASLVASYDNNAAPGNGLADGTYDAAPGVAPTWGAATGWTFNGTDMYLTTGVVPASGWSMIVRFSDVAVNSRWLMGSEAPQFYLASNWAGGVLYGANGIGFRNPGIASGVIAIAGQQPYRNGATDGATVGAGGWATVRPIAIGALNSNGAIVYYVNGKIQAAAIYNATLTAPQVAAVSTAMMAL